MGYEMRGLKFDQFEPGQMFYTARRTITEADVTAFAGLSGDYNPLHTDAVYMSEHPFKKRIAHGMLGMSIATGLANQLGIFEGTTLALMEMTIKYKGAIMFGDTVHLEIEVGEKTESRKPTRGTVKFQCNLKNQDGKTVINSQWTCLMER